MEQNENVSSSSSSSLSSQLDNSSSSYGKSKIGTHLANLKETLNQNESTGEWVDSVFF